MNIPILKKNQTFTPHIFYTQFLKEIALAYRKFPNGKIQLTLNEEGQNSLFESTYRIDPITIPLLLSLSEQLKKFHNEAIDLILYNTRGTIDVLEFLELSDFFSIAGLHENSRYPSGKSIFNFDEKLIGAFKGKKIRPNHKVRAYSIHDSTNKSLIESFSAIHDEEKLRDLLIEQYTYIVKEHFSELLFNNEVTSNQHNLFINILSELITNGVVHSKSTTFALMFVDRFKAKFSISDNGIGFSESLKNKKENNYFHLNELSKKIGALLKFKNINQAVVNNLISIFETLFYSFMKNRRGIFDLMTTVVLNSKGYFRLHSENSQIIVSNRMKDQLVPLAVLRESIFECHNKYAVGLLKEDVFLSQIDALRKQSLSSFVDFFNSVQNKFNDDYQFSSIRFYTVKFRGVHIEVEIPNK